MHPIDEQRQPAATVFSTRPARMLVGKDMVLRVRHQSQHISTRVANPGNVEQRAIGVMGVCTLCGMAIGQAVNQRDLIINFQLGGTLRIVRYEIALTVRHRTVDRFG